MKSPLIRKLVLLVAKTDSRRDLSGLWNPLRSTSLSPQIMVSANCGMAADVPLFREAAGSFLIVDWRDDWGSPEALRHEVKSVTPREAMTAAATIPDRMRDNVMSLIDTPVQGEQRGPDRL